MGGKGSGRRAVLETDRTTKKDAPWWASDLSELTQLSDYREYFKRPMSGYSSGVDYIRATEPLHVATVSSGRSAIEWVNRVIEETGTVTVEPKGQVMLGFKGYQVDSVFAGMNTTHAMYQISGSRAAKGHNYLPVGAHITRVDIALTVYFKEYHPRLAESLARTASFWSPPNGRPPSLTLLKSYRDEGDTLQLGSRSSEVYVRLYDKFAESNYDQQWAYAWRWEVELKGKTAGDVYANYHDQLNNPAACGAIIASLCRGRGLPCFGTDYALTGEVRSSVREATDYEEKLKWLRRQVAPTLQRLKADGAPNDFLAELLGLGAYGEDFGG